MHVDHARILLQRIVRVRIDADDITGIAAGLSKTCEVIAPKRCFVGVEETTCNEVSLLVEAALCVLVDHDCRTAGWARSKDVVNACRAPVRAERYPLSMMSMTWRACSAVTGVGVPSRTQSTSCMMSSKTCDSSMSRWFPTTCGRTDAWAFRLLRGAPAMNP